jgi:inorganic pyrophosphatase
MKVVPLSEMETFDPETGDLITIIETPKGSRNKFKYDEKRDLFKLNKVLPAGAVFPFDFGFIPSTAGEDGDPLDVLVLMDEPVFPGNLTIARLIGVIEAEQEDKGKMGRNDRLVAVASECRDFGDVRRLDDLNDNLVSEIEHFFVQCNEMIGRKFKPIGRRDGKQARKLVEQGQKRFQQVQEGEAQPAAKNGK